jgi:hypothetical protein
MRIEDQKGDDISMLNREFIILNRRAACRGER